MKYCNQCGAQNADNAAFCAGCGMPWAAGPQASPIQPLAQAGVAAQPQYQAPAQAPPPQPQNAAGQPQYQYQAPPQGQMPQQPYQPQQATGQGPQYAPQTQPPGQQQAPPQPQWQQPTAYGQQPGPYGQPPYGTQPGWQPPPPNGGPPKKKKSVWRWLAPVLIAVLLIAALVVVWLTGILGQALGWDSPSAMPPASSLGGRAPAGGTSSVPRAPAGGTSQPAADTGQPGDNPFMDLLADTWEGHSDVVMFAEYETYKRQMDEIYDFSWEQDFSLTVYHTDDYDNAAIEGAFGKAMEENIYTLFLVFNYSGDTARMQEMAAAYGVEVYFCNFA